MGLIGHGIKLYHNAFKRQSVLEGMKQKTKPKGIERIYYFNRVIVCERK